MAAGGVASAIALVRSADPASTISYVGLTATAKTATFVGLGDLLIIEANDITVELNQATDSTDADATPAVFDFGRFGTDGLAVRTGGDPLNIAYDTKVLRTSIGDAILKVSEFVFIRGALAFEVGSEVTIDDTAGTAIAVTSLTLGGDNLHVFAGVGGPYWTDSNDDGVINGDDTPITAGAMGVALGGVQVGVGIFTPTATGATDSYLALKVSAASAAFIGIEGLTLEAKGIEIGVNQVKSTNPTA